MGIVYITTPCQTQLYTEKSKHAVRSSINEVIIRKYYTNEVWWANCK
jgi:hypothetical protein